jgi:hypothetical protein
MDTGVLLALSPLHLQRVTSSTRLAYCMYIPSDLEVPVSLAGLWLSLGVTTRLIFK